MTLPISIIIPTLNEEKAIGELLTCLQKQTMLPKEIIVADAKSTDKTRQIAKSYGCTVVTGGLPGKGRNAGAKVATQPLLLFLDADVILPPKFLEKTYHEMQERHLQIASCLVTPRSHDKKDEIIATLWNSYFVLLETVQPHACGFCIFVTKALHLQINGFDETILIGEDINYVQRAAKITKFAFLDSQKIAISFRRYIEEGRMKIIMKYIGITLHEVFLGHVKKDIFDYKFGEHTKI